MGFSCFPPKLTHAPTASPVESAIPCSSHPSYLNVDTSGLSCANTRHGGTCAFACVSGDDWLVPSGVATCENGNWDAQSCIAVYNYHYVGDSTFAYVGCFSLSDSAFTNDWVAVSAPTATFLGLGAISSAADCAEACEIMGFPYFGMINEANACRCGYFHGEQQVSSKDCAQDASTIEIYLLSGWFRMVS